MAFEPIPMPQLPLPPKTEAEVLVWCKNLYTALQEWHKSNHLNGIVSRSSQNGLTSGTEYFLVRDTDDTIKWKP